MAFDHQYPRVYKAKVCPWIFQLYELDNPFLKEKQVFVICIWNQMTSKLF